MDTTEGLPAPTAGSLDLDHVMAVAKAYLKQHKLDKAMSTLRGYVQETEEVHGEDEPESIWALRNCAVVLAKNGKYDEAEPFLRKFLAKTAEYSDESNEYTRWSMSALGFCLFKTKKFEEGNRVFKELLDDQRQVLGEKDLETLETITYYLQSLLESGQFQEEAVALLNDCHQLIKTIDKDDENKVKLELLKVGNLLFKHGKCKLGQDIVHEVLTRQRDIFGPEHPETIKMMKSEFDSMLFIAQEEEGRQPAPIIVLILRSRWIEMKEFLGESHVDTVSALDIFADIVWFHEKNESTLLLYQKVFDARRMALGDNHQDTISARETLQSRMDKIKHPEASDVCAHLASKQTVEASNKDMPGSTTRRSRHLEHKDRESSQGTDNLCRFCNELDTVSYLGRAQVYVIDDSSYPTSDQTAKELLSRRDCALCQLVSDGFSTLLQISVAQLDPEARVSYRYILPQTLDRHPGEGFSKRESVGIVADMLLLEVSVQHQGRLWIHAVETGGGCAEQLEAVADASLTLTESSRYKGSVSLTEYDFSSAMSLLFQEKIGELKGKLADLGEKYGYLKGRPVSKFVDTSLLKTWIHYCDSHHGVKCRPISMTEDSDWRPTWLIDVEKDMIVPGSEAGAAVCYAALSYVWGDSKKQLKHTATGGIAASIKSPGGLTKNIPPNTVKDAMELCRQIGIPYLWVDAICLDQDRVQEDLSILNSMGKIYQGAHVTIVAAAGNGSHSGLSGIGHCRPNQESLIRQVGNMSLGFYMGFPANMIEDSNWNTRAWTFQEMLLSKRLLIFTEKEVLYWCSSGVAWRESVFLEHPQLESASFSVPSAECKDSQLSLAIEEIMNDDAHDDAHDHHKSRIGDIYSGIVRGYLHREMTKSEDVLKALQGILTVVTERTTQPFYKGIPVGDVFHSLLFDVTGSPLRRPSFPSWSWCGWQNIRATNDADQPGLRFIELGVQRWFKPKVILYWLSPGESDENNKKACNIYSLNAINKRDDEAEPCDIILVDATKKGADWKKQIENMLVFTTDTMRVNFDRQGQGEEFTSGSNLRRYSISSMKLNLQFLKLHKSWGDTQSACQKSVALEFIALGEAKAFDEKDIGLQCLPIVDWERHMIALVAVLLVETNIQTGISTRLGLYQIEKEYWDRAVKSEREVYLC